jgi:solute carrier family 30 (zinc transporter), member 1
MLNDVLSLCVGLWAVKVAGSKARSSVYTYGWQRAETLGALINGVFLVALCVSIFLEAIQRFVEPQEVSHPVLILAVGCAGLASNIVGLALFHDHSHGHAHGGSGHAHGQSDGLAAAEEGHIHGLDTAEAIADETGNVADVLPESHIANWSSTKPMPTQATKKARTSEDRSSEASARRARRRSRSRAYSTIDEIYVHPTSFRDSIIAAGRLEDVASASASDTENEAQPNGSASEEAVADTENTPLLSTGKSRDNAKQRRRLSISNGLLHRSHKHAQPKESGKKGGHGHGHDLNMRGVFLHVMGDALGNIGVIATALFIWLTDFSWRFYSDPLVSLIITVIILCSAIPLCKAASRILLQAVPAGLNISDIQEDIMELPDIRSCHHLHVWQLSDTKLVASLHVQVDFEFEGDGSQRYMALARQIRKCLHEYGIHSSTIQPEFCCEATHGHKLVKSREHTDDEDTCEEEEEEERVVNAHVREGSHGCLLDCDDECGDGAKCCGPPAPKDSGSGNGTNGGKK